MIWHMNQAAAGRLENTADLFKCLPCVCLAEMLNHTIGKHNIEGIEAKWQVASARLNVEVKFGIP